LTGTVRFDMIRAACLSAHRLTAAGDVEVPTRDPPHDEPRRRARPERA
jgi:hypothetical protein